MCGRYTQLLSWNEFVERYRDFLDGLDTPLNLRARYNIAPTQDVPVLRLEANGKGHIRMLRWGLVPFWAKPGPTARRSSSLC